MKIIKSIKQFKKVMELQEENEILYADKVYYQTELEEEQKKYDIANKRCQRYYKLFSEIKDIVNENQNGSVINMQNRIKTKLKEFKL